MINIHHLIKFSDKKEDYAENKYFFVKNRYYFSSLGYGHIDSPLYVMDPVNIEPTATVMIMTSFLMITEC